MLTVPDRINLAKNALAEFCQVVEPILDIDMVYFDKPHYSLRSAVIFAQNALATNWLDHDQSAAACRLNSAFARVAHNLPPESLRQAIEWMFFTSENLVLVAELRQSYKMQRET
ncbi:MAG: hypothetical protein AAFQ89_08500 [Cyanobacteria bacterium J06626_18]